MIGKERVLELIHQKGVIGIFRTDEPDNCIKAMDALIKGGLNIFEVTTTTPDAAELVSLARRKYGAKALVGMGTVLDAKTAVSGIDSGAQFIVSLSLDKSVVGVCKKRGVVSCPGTFTATEVIQASRWGADLIKVFPVSQVGPGYISALLGPLPSVKLVPTGGVDVKTAGDYIRAGAYALGVGGALVSKVAIAEGKFADLTAAAMKILTEVKLARGDS
jgi:2-dehydro-3-deoxyphosphogluconate aldolase/(4S)-4-hydroxy-2-oxoglutarate aldolase